MVPSDHHATRHPDFPDGMFEVESGRQDHDRIRFLPSKYDAVRQLVAVTGASRMFD
jgi:hypothetical protein